MFIDGYHFVIAKLKSIHHLLNFEMITKHLQTHTSCGFRSGQTTKTGLLFESATQCSACANRWRSKTVAFAGEVKLYEGLEAPSQTPL